MFKVGLITTLKLESNIFLFVGRQNSSSFKGNAQFVQKVTFEPLIDLKQNHFGS